MKRPFPTFTPLEVLALIVIATGLAAAAWATRHGALESIIDTLSR